MESASDLLNLPTYPECEGDRNFQYPYGRVIRNPFLFNPGDRWRYSGIEWRRRVHRKMMDKYHYDNIFRLKQVISEHDKRITQLSKGANAPARIRIVESRRRPLVSELQELKRGWEEVAIALREESKKLFILPLELRRKIYGYLYTRSKPEPIYLDSPDIDVRDSVLPRDPFFYLNASIVDPVIAAEAAEVLYDTNTFDVMGLGYYGKLNLLSHFLRTDHFGSNVVPKNVLCRLHITLPTYRQAGASLTSVLEITTLRVFSLRIVGYSDDYFFEYRNLIPIIRMLQRQAVVVRVFQSSEQRDLEAEGKDISRIFDDPSPADRELTRNIRTNKPLQDWTDSEKFAVARVDIASDKLVFEKEIDALRQVKENIDSMAG